MSSALDKDVVQKYWQHRAKDTNSRWTGIEMLNYEKAFLKSMFPNHPISILDLGCGSGELSKSIKRPGDKLIAVDQEKSFSRFFDETECEFVCKNVSEYSFVHEVDIILFFGVVNFLTDDEITQVFHKIARLKNPNLQFIVKAQFASEEEYVVNKYSDELDFQYSARYLKLDHFMSLISQFTQNIQIIDYPPEFNKRVGFIHRAVRIYGN